MTSATDDLNDHLDPIGPDGLSESQWQEQYVLVKACCVAMYSKIPLHQARAAKDPNYWRNLEPFGGWDLTDDK